MKLTVKLITLVCMVCMVCMVMAIPVSAGLVKYDIVPEGADENALVTRHEMAEYTVRLIGLANAAEAAAGDTEFLDVGTQDAFSGYINIAHMSGIINGMGDGNFAPYENVTFEQAVKMVVAALGYTPKAESIGGYPTGYLMVSAQAGINRGITANANEAVTFAQVKALLTNALYSPVMEQTSFAPGGAEYEIMDGPGVISTPETKLLSRRGFHIIGQDNAIILSAEEVENAELSGESELTLTLSKNGVATLAENAEDYALRAIVGVRIVANFTVGEINEGKLVFTAEDYEIEDILRDINETP